MSEVNTNAMIDALEAQRNSALNDVVRANGKLAVAIQYAQQLEAENKALKDKYEPKSQEKTDASGPDSVTDK